MPKILHLADVHLGASYSAFGDGAAARRAEVIAAFGALSRIAEEEAAEAVLIAGDLFDGPGVDDTTVAAAREGLRRVAESMRPVFIIPGNHDSVTLRRNIYRELANGREIVEVDAGTPTLEARRDRVYIFMAPAFTKPVEVVLESGQLNVYGFAFDRARNADPLSTFVRADSPGIHVVLLHGPIPMASHWKQSPNALSLPIEALRRIRADYIALGDFHRLWRPVDFSPAGDVNACYPGSFASLDLTETGERGYAVADVRPGESPIITFRSTTVQGVCELGDFDVSELDNDAAVASAIAGMSPGDRFPVVRLIGAPRFPLDPARVAAALERQFGCARVSDQTSFIDSARLAVLESEDTVAGHLVRLARERITASNDPDERRQLDGSLRVALSAMGVA